MKKLLVPFCLTLIIFIGSVGVSASADFQKGFTAYFSGDYATALREFKSLAEQRDDTAQYYLGKMYEYGRGVPKDFKTALKWFRLSMDIRAGSNISRLRKKISKKRKNANAENRIADLELKKKKEADARRIADLELKKKKEADAQRIADLELKKKKEAVESSRQVKKELAELRRENARLKKENQSKPIVGQFCLRLG